MVIKYSQRSNSLKPSPLQDFFKRVKVMEKNGKNILSLGFGDLNINTPNLVKKEAISAIKNNLTHYVPASGSISLKKTIAKKYNCTPEEVIVSSGAKAVIAAILWSILDKGDQILIPTPYYPPFCEAAKSLGAKITLVDTKKDGFYLTAKNLENIIKNKKLKPKVLIINSPNNPTGVEYEKSELKKMVALSKKYGFIIISDECYSNYSADKNFTLRKISKGVVVINSTSKTYAMTGWRIGWAIISKDLARKVTLYLENYVGCPNSIAECAATIALQNGGIDDFKEQREIIFEWLDDMGINYNRVHSGLYAFVDFSKFIGRKKNIKNATKLAEYLLGEGIAVTPGEAFGNFPNYLRISYCVDLKYLRKALLRLKGGLRRI